MKSEIKSIDQKVVNKMEEKSQALNGWIAADLTSGEITGIFSGIKVMAGETLTITLTFESNSPCDTNGVIVDLIEGDYIPTPGLIAATVVAGKCFLIKDQLI